MSLNIQQIKEKFSELNDVLRRNLFSNTDISSTILERTKAPNDFLKFLGEHVTEYQQTLAKPMGKEHNGETSALCFVHYTSMKATISILKEGLRLCAASEMNDSMEGRFLKDEIKKKYHWMGNVRDVPDAFLCSFIRSDNQQISDYITYWQSYGKDGLGCSIRPSLSRELRECLFPVQYGMTAVEKAINHFHAFFEFGGEIYQQLQKNTTQPVAADFAKDFWNKFNEIKFLYKHIGYEKEEECRYIKKSYANVKYDVRETAQNGLIVKSHIDEPKLSASEIFDSESEIYIGPSVENKLTVKSYLEKTVREISENGTSAIHGVRFCISEIPYRR